MPVVEAPPHPSLSEAQRPHAQQLTRHAPEAVPITSTPWHLRPKETVQPGPMESELTNIQPGESAELQGENPIWLDAEKSLPEDSRSAQLCCIPVLRTSMAV